MPLFCLLCFKALETCGTEKQQNWTVNTLNKENEKPSLSKTRTNVDISADNLISVVENASHSCLCFLLREKTVLIFYSQLLWCFPLFENYVLFTPWGLGWRSLKSDPWWEFWRKMRTFPWIMLIYSPSLVTGRTETNQNVILYICFNFLSSCYIISLSNKTWLMAGLCFCLLQRVSAMWLLGLENWKI